MNITILPDYEQLSIRAADFFVRCLQTHPSAVLGLATGSTPLGVYQQLIVHSQSGDIDFSQVTTFNLDEYIGLRPDHPQSYYSFMQREFFQHLTVPPTRMHIPSGVETDFGTYCQWYEDQITESGGIDLQILGIGTDGHIASLFPNTDPQVDDPRQVVRLTPDPLPPEAPFDRISLTLPALLASDALVFVIRGDDKREILNQAIAGTHNFPVARLLRAATQPVTCFT